MPAELDDTRLTAMGLLVETYGGVTARLDAVHAAHGLSGTDFDVLIRLARSPEQRLRMSDLATQTGLSTSGITRIVDRLERNGFAARQSHPADRRALLAVLTDHGRSRLTELMPPLLAEIEHWLTGPLEPTQLTALLDALRTIRAAVRPGATAAAPDARASAE
jgi:MarR family 2-MHQ and catechol resistance regulon transcriptional repressor